MTLKIVTHSFSDLDAILSMYLVETFLIPETEKAELFFLPANTPKEDLENFDFVVDMGKVYDPEKGRFDHHGNFTNESAVSLLKKYLDKMKIKTFLEPLLEYVHHQDLSGNYVREIVGRKNEVLEFTSLHNILCSLRNARKSDLEIYLFFKEIFNALSERKKALSEVEKNISKVVSFPHPSIAIIDGGTGLETVYVWEEFPQVKIVIYRDGNNIGLIRRDGEEIDLTKLQQYIDEEGWFFHITGFIAARGTKKAPADSPSKYKPDDLAKIALDLFSSQLISQKR
jgi:uncharacterized UPF0160 family protein